METMNTTTAIPAIRERVPCTDYLQKSKGNGMYICPFCGSGEGPHGTGALKLYDTNTWTCHKCGKSGDVIDIYRQIKKLEFKPALNELARECGIEIIDGPADFRTGETPTLAEYVPPNTEIPTQEPAKAPAEPQNYLQYYAECENRLEDPAAYEYLIQRGISLETARRFQIGYNPADDPTGQGHPRASLIIPVSPFHYVSRAIYDNGQYAKMDATPGEGYKTFWNLAAAYEHDAHEVFITEGAIDGLSIIEVEPEAHVIALNSLSNAKPLAERLAADRPDNEIVFIIAGDSDGPGRKGAQELKEALEAANLQCITADLNGTAKDPNEALQKDRAAFWEAVQGALKAADRLRDPRPDNTERYLEDGFFQDMKNYRTDVKTGFTIFDKKTRGIFSGLYVLSAIPSLGKTSFALTLADRLAERGQEVLFFSLEMSRFELLSKSLSRECYALDRKGADKPGQPPTEYEDNPLTALDIRCGRNPKLVQLAAGEYRRRCGNRVSLIECNAKTVSYIRQYIEEYIKRTENRPIVFIDYLQIIMPDNDRHSGREAVDDTVTVLRQMVRDLNITVFAISSVNRNSYTTSAGFENLKESGSIEFSADCVMGMQLAALKKLKAEYAGKKGGEEKLKEELNKEKAAVPRNVELVISKNRFGLTADELFFRYDPRCDLFNELLENPTKNITAGIPAAAII